MDHGPELSPDDIARLRRHPEPPAALEARVVAALRADGLIRAPSRWSAWALLAASVLIFGGGVATGHLMSSRSSASLVQRSDGSPARYLLLLAGDVTPAADGSTRAAEYGDWARNLAARGVSISGEELTSHVEIVTRKADAAFPDLSSAGGYFLIDAADDDAAAAIARTCPHVKYGGSVIVRRITSGRR